MTFPEVFVQASNMAGRILYAAQHSIGSRYAFGTTEGGVRVVNADRPGIYSIDI